MGSGKYTRFAPIMFEIMGLLTIFVIAFFLRFPNLGYSDYIGDEHKALIRLSEGETVWDFFMDQRKGPLQFLVSHIPYLFTGDFRNEFAERLPFTIFGFLSIFVFYFFVRRITENKFVAFLSALFLSFNGFIIGFSRIAQYQNLNLFFSFLALYFYLDFYKPSKNLVRNTVFGTISFSLSLLSHWDAVFILIPILYFLIVFTRNTQLSLSEKKKVILLNFGVGSLIFLPFLVPYIWTQINHPSNGDYFLRRVSPGFFSPEGYIQLIRLYNPFLLLEFMLITGLIGLFGRKSWLYFLWFLISYTVFQIFVRKPGTHIYNFMIPYTILSGWGVYLLIKKAYFMIRPLIIVGIMPFIIFFVYQAHLIFVDNRVEYPWSREQLLPFLCDRKVSDTDLILNVNCRDLLSYFITPTYSIQDKLPLFGFPLSRNWNEINDFINNENKIRGENFGYISNELKTITEKYMDAKYRVNKGFYIVAIRKPLSFEDDWQFVQFSRKRLIKEFYKDSVPVVRIYRVEPGEEK